jgi:hypothetical protein
MSLTPVNFAGFAIGFIFAGTRNAGRHDWFVGRMPPLAHELPEIPTCPTTSSYWPVWPPCFAGPIFSCRWFTTTAEVTQGKLDLPQAERQRQRTIVIQKHDESGR